MRVVARKVNWSEVPDTIEPFTKESQTFLTVGREYDVHALTVFECFVSMLVVNDSKRPDWVASWLVEIVDDRVPSDWTCRAFEGEPILVLGPEFIARDHASYGAMVECEPDQVERLWERIKAAQGELEQ